MFNIVYKPYDVRVFCVCIIIHKIIRQGWATFLVSGSYVGRRSPSRAGLLDGSSSIFSTTTIVRVAVIGREKKGLHTPQMSCVSTENMDEAVA